MVGCKGCGESLQAEAAAKKERGAELTEQEQAVIDADDPNDVVPTVFGIPAYGRLSPYDGVFCGFCEKVGLGLALVVTLLVAYALPEPLSHLHLALVALAVVAQVGMVLYFGRYLVLGAVFGPIVERVFAQMGIYLTEKAKQEYQPEPTDSAPGPIDDAALPDDAVVEADGGAVDVHLPGNPTDREEQLAEQLEQQKQLTRKERAEKNEYRSELQNTRKEVTDIQSQKEQVEQQKQETTKELKELEGRIDVLFNTYGRDRTVKNAIPCLGWDEHQNPVFKGFVVNTVWHTVTLDHYSGEYPNALLVDTLEDATDLSQIDGGLPDRIDGMADFDRLAQYGQWLLDPRDVDDFPQFMNPERPGFPTVDPSMPVQARDAYPNVLFWNSGSGLREARTEPDNDSRRPKLPFYIHAYDDAGRYVPPAFDPRGSENLSDERDKRRKYERLLGLAQHNVSELKEQLQQLSHEYDILEEKYDAKDSRLLEARERESDALTGARKLERELDSVSARATSQDHKISELYEENEYLDEQRKKHRREKLAESDSVQRELDASQSKRDSESAVLSAFYAIKSRGYAGNGKDLDLEAVENGESDYAMEDVIRTFLNDDAIDKPDKMAIRKELPGDFVSGGETA